MKNKNEKKVVQDLNYLMEDKHKSAKIRRAIYGRVVFLFLLIAVQVSVLVLFVLKLRPYIEFYFGGSLLISAIFVIYLANTKGRVEFKMSWVLLLLFSPIIGIVAYIIFHSDIGNKEIKKRLEYLEKKTCQLSPPREQSEKLLDRYPEVKGICEYLDRKGLATPYTNTKVKYFKNGEEFLPDFCQSLQNAKKFIFLEFFIIDIDESWVKICNILEEKAKEGVEVRLMYDGFGSTTVSTKKYQKYLKEKGFNTHVFMPLIPFFSVHLNNRDHRKIAVIDGEIAYTGGLNLTNEYFNVGKNRFNYWKDNGIRVEGPAINNYTQLFLQTWNLQTKGDDDYEKYLNLPYKTYEEDGIVVPYGDDVYNKEDIAEDVYSYMVNNAKKYLHITSPYLIIDHALEDDLIFAAKRGVDVKLILPSVPDHYLTFCVGKTFIKTLVDNGVKVYMYNRGFIHAKTFISDDIISTVGTANLDYRSLYHHYETNTLMYKNSAISDVEKDFNETIEQYCSLVKKEDYKKLPLKMRFMGRLFRILSPLL